MMPVAVSTLLTIPQELREEILHYLTLPGTVYTSSTEADASLLYQTVSRKTEKAYVDTRIYLPSRPPANILSTCRQLRQEGLQHHTYLFNSSTGIMNESPQVRTANNTRIAEYLSTEFDEAAERAVDDCVTLRLTLEVQRGRRNPLGFSVPAREDLSPRFLALLPLMSTVRKLKLVVWPGVEWWNGTSQVSPLEQWRQRKALLKRINAYQVGHTDQPNEAEAAKTHDVAAPKLDAVSVAVGKVMDQLTAVEELELNVLIATGDLFRWDLPDIKWERVQPWLDGPVMRSSGAQLRKVSRTLTSVWQLPEAETASHQPFYVQRETRIDTSSDKWQVDRQAGFHAVSNATIRMLQPLS